MGIKVNYAKDRGLVLSQLKYIKTYPTRKIVNTKSNFNTNNQWSSTSTRSSDPFKDATIYKNKT